MSYCLFCVIVHCYLHILSPFTSKLSLRSHVAFVIFTEANGWFQRTKSCWFGEFQKLCRLCKLRLGCHRKSLNGSLWDECCFFFFPDCGTGCDSLQYLTSLIGNCQDLQWRFTSRLTVVLLPPPSSTICCSFVSIASIHVWDGLWSLFYCPLGGTVQDMVRKKKRTLNVSWFWTFTACPPDSTCTRSEMRENVEQEGVSTTTLGRISSSISKIK